MGQARYAEGMTSCIPSMSEIHEQMTLIASSKIAEADIASQARNAATYAGQGIQTGAASAGNVINNFVEGSDKAATKRNVEPEKKDFWDSFGAAPQGPSQDKQDFWDEFSSAGEARAQGKTIGTGAAKKPSGIGTSAVKKAKKEDEGWGDW